MQLHNEVRWGFIAIITGVTIVLFWGMICLELFIPRFSVKLASNSLHIPFLY